MTEEYKELKKLHTQLLFLNTDITTLSPEFSNSSVAKAVQLLSNGQYLKLCSLPDYKSKVFNDERIRAFTNSYIRESASNTEEELKNYVNQLTSLIIDNLKNNESEVLMVAVLLVQMFVQLNYTGPKFPIDIKNGGLPQLGFLNDLILSSISNTQFGKNLQNSCLHLLSIGGQVPSKLVDSPILLVLGLRLVEKLQNTNLPLLGYVVDHNNDESSTDEIVSNSGLSTKLNTLTDVLLASTCWWRVRFLQIQQSLLPEENSIITSLSLNLLTGAVANCFINRDDVNSVLNQAILVTYHLETARNALAGNMESISTESLTKAKKCSGLEFVMTGCKAKRTKFQTTSTAALTVLAKSQDGLFNLTNGSAETGEDADVGEVKLNDDLFLERIQYDSVGDNSVFQEDEQEQAGDELKRVKIDYSNFDSEIDEESDAKKLLPIAMTEENIPKLLTTLDPNNQPSLSNLDNIQLLLRLETIRENSPASNQLVNEELISLVQRVLFTPDESITSINWLIFSRALWLRSLLEATRSKTVERGVLQLYSLVEELGVTSDKTARIFPKTKDEITFPTDFLNLQLDDSKILPNSIRSKYIHLLPLMPKWSMDSTLATKLIELGSLKSAVDIYERLEEWIDAALCYASTGNESKAEELIMLQLAETPDDPRCLSILGDIKQDPKLWERAWELGRYANAKKSLAKYYYNPPKSSGLKRDYQAVLDHQFDCLSANPINFDNWYFYGCIGLEINNYDLAAEAFTRCVAIDETSAYSWSNLATAFIRQDKLKEAFTALKKAVSVGDNGDSSKSWKIWENYLIVAAKLDNWDDVLFASRILLKIKKDVLGSDSAVDLPILYRLVELLTGEPYDESIRQSHFQKSCIEFVCQMVPSVVTDNATCWRIIAKVNMWMGKPWSALENYEKSYRAVVNSPALTNNEKVWDEAVECCSELVSAYQRLGVLPGKHGAGDVVCKDWKFKSKSSVRSLISKGKDVWEGTEGYKILQQLKNELDN